MTCKMRFLVVFIITTSILSSLAEAFFLKDAIIKKRSRPHFVHTTAAPPLTMCPGYPLPVANTSELQARLEPFLEKLATNVTEILKADKSPGGVVVSVVYRDAVMWTKGFGVVNMSDPKMTPPDGDTAYRIGSISKVFTALLMLLARDEGTLHSLDSDVTRTLPQLKIRNPFQTHRGITYRQLSSHMSGLQREIPCPKIYDNGCDLPYDEIYDILAGMELEFPPGYEPQYSNLGFGILGRAVQMIRGIEWEDDILKSVAKPLKMIHTGTEFTEETLPFIAPGYTPDGKKAKLINLGFGAPAGQMYSSSNDLAKLMMLIFQPEKTLDPSSGQILDGETLREWMQPAYTYHDGSGYGHPWELNPYGNFTLRNKGGEINGYQAEFQMAVFTQASMLLKELQPAHSLPPNPPQYVGKYTGQTTVEGNSTMNVILGEINGKQVLLLQNPPFEVVLNWIEEDSFQITGQGLDLPCLILGAGQLGERVYAQRTGGKVSGLTFPGLLYGVVFEKIA